VFRFTIVGDDVRLQPKAALTLALVLHELATNAAKHGALLADTRRIYIDWQIAPDMDGGGGNGRRLCLRWQESGGPPVVSPTRRGFGSRLIQRGLEQELDGEVHVEYEPGGVMCQIAMPWSQEARRQDRE
jgi:two-component system CheB/CheR fusion protein